MLKQAKTYRSKRQRQRRGSALLLCTLAIAVISMASVAILRSTHRNVARVEGIRLSRQAHCESDGLLQRAYAMLRVDPAFSGTVTDPARRVAEARADVQRLSANATRIRVFLYAAAAVPAREAVVDPNLL